MTTDPIVKLIRGERELDISIGRYRPEIEFSPPSTQTTPLIATGTSANRFDGGSFVDKKGINKNVDLPVKVTGATDAEVSRGGQDMAAFLTLDGQDEVNPLYLYVRGNSDVASEPIWGNYGVGRYYEVVHATTPQVWNKWYESSTRATSAHYNSSLTIKPYAVGIEQALASATGGILEDTIGWKDGFSRGLIIPEATTNLFLNPIFGHSTWNNGWTNAASVTDTENTDKRFVLFGKSSAKLVCNGASNRSFTESIDVGDTNTYELSCHVKLADGGVVSTDQVTLFYGASGPTTTFTAIGDDDWYRLTASLTGIASSQNAGVIVADGFTVYVDGFQLEEKDFATPLSYGDLMGNAWAGTAHASTSTRTVARVRIPETNVINNGEGTIRAIVRFNNSSSDLSSGNRDVAQSNGGFRLRLNTSSVFTWFDGTNVTSGGATQSFAEGAIFALHAVWNPTDGLINYVDSASDSTNATYTPLPLGSDLYFGTSTGVGNHGNFTVMEFATYGRAMTAAEVLADYTNTVKLTDDNQRVGTIPWLWTKDGDDVADNCLDSAGSTGAPHNNYSVMGGIPGSDNAVTQFRLQLTGGAPAALAFMALISRLDVDEYFDPDGQIFQDYSGAAASDVSYCGGDYEVEAVDTDVAFPTAVTLNNSIFDRHLTDKEFECYTRLHDAGADLTMAWRVSYGLNAEIDIPYRPISTTTTDKLYGNEKIRMMSGLDLFSSEGLNPTVKWQPLVKRTTGGPDNVRFDFAMLLARPLMRIRLSPGLFDGSNSPDSYLVKGDRGITFVESSDNVDDTARVEGDIVELVPEKINIMMSALADGIDDDHVNTHTLTYTSVKVTPRYQIL